ncbi:MAG: flavodoxin family protein [Treponema sp.]|nr:flavodoxin family protein [Candidatus Treponema equifaecale]
MKVLLINGSRKDNGCTFTALNIIAEALKEGGIDSQIFNVGSRIFKGEIEAVVKEAAELIKTCDGLVVGSPVYYASPSGEVVSFLDRFFGIAEADLRYKPACAISTCRRAGNTACLDVLNKYFTYSQMPVVSSRYWNEVHGSTPEQVLQDAEGIQIMKILAKNLTWLIKSIEAGKKSGIEQPKFEEKIFTNFIR